MHRYSTQLKGEVRLLELRSDALQNNLLKDPSTRAVPVYLPPDYTKDTSYPLVVELAPYTNSGLGRVGWKNFTENMPERLDRLIQEEKIPPVVGLFPDSFTGLGGNQFLNSPILGNWADHIHHELIPFVESQFNCGGADQRYCFGKSSGGYGALVYGMLYPQVWTGIACHAGDMGFDTAEIPLIPQACETLAQHDGKTHSFLEAFRQTDKPTSAQIHTLMLLCFAATYDPDPAAFPEIPLPFDLETAELIPQRWDKWTSWDPVELIEHHSDALKKLKKLYLDCGSYDQYSLQYGARRFKRKLEQKGVSYYYEEFPDNHSGIDYRYDVSLPYLLS